MREDLGSRIYPDGRITEISGARGDVWLLIEVKIANRKREVECYEVHVRMEPSTAFATAGELQAAACQVLEEKIAGKEDA